jgi:hypothetical protein
MVAHICKVLPKGGEEGRGEGGGGCVKPPSLRGDKLLIPCNRFKRLVSVIFFCWANVAHFQILSARFEQASCRCSYRRATH